MLGRITHEADGVESNHQFFRSVTRATSCLTVEIDQGAKASGLSTNDGDRQWETELARARERGRRATCTDPYWQRVLQWARINPPVR